jgi:tetratricopeptide (TPR) repeat protein
MVLLLALAAVLFAPALQAPPILDDLGQIAHVSRFGWSTALFGQDCYGFFRPVKNLLFYYYVAGMDGHPVAGHVVALVFFLLGVVLVERYSALFFPKGMWSVLCAAIWALAPTQVSSVAWLSCLNILFMTVAALLALLAHERALKAEMHEKMWHTLSMLAALAAMLSYEMGVVVVVLFPLHDAAIDPERLRARKAWGRYMILALMGVIYLLVRARVSDLAGLDNEHFGPMSDAQLVARSGFLAVSHLAWWLWPFGRQTLLQTFTLDDAGMLQVAGAWVVVVLLGVSAIACWRRSGIAGGALLWAMLTFLPVSNLLPLHSGPFADYYLVFPSVGLALFFTVVIKGCTDKLSNQGDVERSRFALICVLLMGAWLVGRAAVVPGWSSSWRDESTLHRRTLAASPGSYTASALLGRYLAERGQLEEAEDLARSAVTMAPWYRQGYYVLADILRRKGAYGAGIAVLDDAVARHDDATIAWVMKGHLQQLSGRREGAMKSYREALNRPWEAEYSLIGVMNLAGMYYEQGAIDKALETWLEGIERAPHAGVLHIPVAFAYVQRGDMVRARYHTERALELGEDVPPSLLNQFAE